jgi:O-antigen ligase
MPFIALLVMFVAGSMPYINPMTPRINSDLAAFLGLGLFGLFTHLSLAREHQTFRWNALSLLCGFWFVLACLQFISGVYTGYFSSFLISVSYFLAVVLLTAWVGMWVQAQRAAELAHAVMLAVWLAGMVTALAIGLQMLGWQDVLSPWLQKSVAFPRNGGFLSQPNLAASLMTSALLCVVFLSPNTPNQAALPSGWRCLSMAVLLVAMYGTSSRTGYIEVLAMAAMLAVFRKRFAIHWVWLAMPLWLLLVLVWGEWMSAHQFINAQLAADSVGAVANSSAHRLQIWSDIWRMIQSAPGLAVGWRQLQLSEVLMPGIVEPVDHAHSLFLQIQVELGVLGSLGLLAFLGHVLWVVKPWQNLQSFQVVMLGVAILLGMHSMLEYPLWHALFLFLFTFAMALLLGFVRQDDAPPGSIKLAAIGTVLLTLWVGLDHSHSYKAYRNLSEDKSTEAFIAANQRVWWNRPLFDSVFMLNTPVSTQTLHIVRPIAMENANTYSQTAFANLPLLKLLVLEGKTDVANHLLWRMCRFFPEDLWPNVIRHMAQQAEPRFRDWAAQVPPMQNCKD